MTREDVLLIADPSFRAAVERFAYDEAYFFGVLASAWPKLMNADRFDGPTGNVCSMDSSNGTDGEIDGGSGSNEADVIFNQRLWIAAVLLAAVASPTLLWACMSVCSRKNEGKDEAPKVEMTGAASPCSPRDGVQKEWIDDQISP